MDALRGIAALSVLGFHAWTVFGVLPIFSRAYLAVDFFFILSGFVMARTYEGRFPALSSRRFVALRFKRLWGVMAVGTLIGLASLADSDGQYLPAAVAGLLFIPMLTRFQPFELNRAEWSIFFELWANWVHAALLWRLKTVHLVCVAAACLALVTIYGRGSFLMGNVTPTFVGGFPRVLFAYCIGIVIWRERGQLRLPPVAACLMLPASLIILRYVALDVLFVLLVCPTIVMIGVTQGAGAWGRMLGAISFPLYAVHYPIFQVAHQFSLGPVFAISASLATAGALAAIAASKGRGSAARCEPERV